MSATVTVPARDIRRLAMVGGNVPEVGPLALLGYQLLAISSYGELLSEVGQQNLHTAVIHFEDKEAHDPDAFNILAEIRKLDPNVIVMAVIPEASRMMHARASQWGADEVLSSTTELPLALARMENKKAASGN